jgi:outer membrane protein assembly factor BamA
MHRRASLVLAAALVVPSCGGHQNVQTLRGRDVAIAFRGNESVDSDTLLDGLSLTRAGKAGQDFDPYLVALDEERVRGFYFRHGYFRAAVRSRFDERGKRVEVTFDINEGPRAKLTRVEMTGLPDDPEIDREALREAIPIADGEPFDYKVYDEAKPQLVRLMERAGYARARVEASVAADRVRDEAIIKIEFQPGPLCTFGEIELRGIGGELGEAARKRIVAKKGERYSTTQLELTQAGLYEMGRFAVVRVEPDRTGITTQIPVTIEVTEQDRHELRLGGGVGLDPESADVHGRAGYSIAGWPRPLTTTRLEFRPAIVMQREDYDIQPRVEATAGIERLDLVIPRLRGEAEAQLAYLAVEAYTSFGPRFRLGLRYPILPHVDLAGGWQIRLLRFPKLDEAVSEAAAQDLGLIGSYRLGFYEQSVVVDLRDDPVRTRQGIYGELRAEEGTIGAGGEFEYFQLTPELRGYVPLPLRAVLAGRVRAGGIFGDLPVTQRYFAGGATSHRGFAERRLSPTVSQIVEGEEETAVVGGGGLLETGAELRTHIATWRELGFGAVVFVDGGDVTERIKEIEVTNLHWAVGAGLRVATVIGPVRFDVGYRLNRHGVGEPQPGDRFAFHLSLGEAF